MNDLNARTPAALLLAAAVLIGALHTTSAQAMGHAGRPAPTTPPITERLDRARADQQKIQASMQAQIDALRKELADLKAQVGEQQAMATTP